MMEEYLSFGITGISIPKSNPASTLVAMMPPNLADKVEVLDDFAEIQAAGRALHHYRADIDAHFNEETGELLFKKDTPKEIKELAIDCHNIIRKLAYGFNRGVHVELLGERASSNIKKLRQKNTNSNERVSLAQIEGILFKAEDCKFEAVKPQITIPDELLSSFDRIINDPSYIGYSEAISLLSPGERAQTALTDIRRYGQAIKQSKLAEFSWTFLSVAVSVLGAQLPSFAEVGNAFQNKQFPLLLDMRSARQEAINSWIMHCGSAAPLSVEPLENNDRNMVWLRPSPSIEASFPGERSTSLGRVGDLLTILTEYETTTDRADR